MLFRCNIPIRIRSPLVRVSHHQTVYAPIHFPFNDMLRATRVLAILLDATKPDQDEITATGVQWSEVDKDGMIDLG